MILGFCFQNLEQKLLKTLGVCCYDSNALIVVITAAEGGENFGGPIKDRYWVLV